MPRYNQVNWRFTDDGFASVAGALTKFKTKLASNDGASSTKAATFHSDLHRIIVKLTTIFAKEAGRGHLPARHQQGFS